jgi:hypothetical protein
VTRRYIGQRFVFPALDFGPHRGYKSGLGAKMSVNRRTFVQASTALAGTLAGFAADQTSDDNRQVLRKGMYSDPFIDIDEWRDAPVRHRYVHGG